MQNAMESDMAVIHEDGTKDYADTVPEENIVADQNLQEVVEETTRTRETGTAGRNNKRRTTAVL